MEPKPFYIFITGEETEEPDGTCFQAMNCERSGNIPDTDAIIIMANSIKAILSNTREEIDLDEIFSFIK